MHDLTLGQVLVLFDGLSAYVIMTSPYGGGDEDKKASERGTLTAAQAAALDNDFLAKFGGVALNREARFLPDVARAAIGLN